MSRQRIERFLIVDNPIDAVKGIKNIHDISEELWVSLDEQGNLDAQIYLFFAIIIQDKEFVTKHLGKWKNLNDLCMNELRLLATEFKKTFNITTPGVQFPISTYGINLYNQRYTNNSNLKNQKRIQAHQSLNGIAPKTNTLFHNSFDISQSIDETPVIEILEEFYGNIEKFAHVLSSFSTLWELELYVKRNNNLNYFIQSKIHHKRFSYQDQLLAFFVQAYYLLTTLQSMSSIAETNAAYNTIKDSIMSSFTNCSLWATFLDAPIKNTSRAFEKLLKKYKWEVFELKDIVRCSFTFPDLNNLVQWINLLMQSLHQESIYPLIKVGTNKNPVIEVDDKIGLLLAPAIKPSGYRDISFIIHFRGHKSLVPMEVQFHLEDTLHIKVNWTDKVLDIVKKYFTDKEIEEVNDLLGAKHSRVYLPKSNEDIISADDLYHIRRQFNEDKKASSSTGKKILDTLMYPIKTLLWDDWLPKEEIAARVGSIERNLHDIARKNVLLKLHIFDNLGNHHPLTKYLKNR